MSSHRRELGVRREALAARSERLRSELAADAAELGARFRIADRIVAVARSDAGRMLLVAAAAFVLLGRPRRLLRLVLRALALWPIVRPLVPHARRLLGARAHDEAAI